MRPDSLPKPPMRSCGRARRGAGLGYYGYPKSTGCSTATGPERVTSPTPRTAPRGRGKWSQLHLLGRALGAPSRVYRSLSPPGTHLIGSAGSACLSRSRRGQDLRPEGRTGSRPPAWPGC